MDLIGTVLGATYLLEERLGAGAMGTVYRARHLKIDRSFAVKVLHRELLGHPDLVERFEQEALVAMRLNHPNVVRIIDFGQMDDGIRYIVMDLVPGTPLSAAIGTPMAPARVVNLVTQLLDGLQHAHDGGLIHRDFKPDNVILERGGDGRESLRIVDFGIAIRDHHASSYEARGRLTTMGVVLGTPEYMAPEQARGEVMDHRADLFALGITCYELLTGKLPFDGSGAEVAYENMTNDTPAMGIRVPRIDVDPLLEAFTRKLTCKAPKDRPPTASAARALLQLIVTDRTAAAIALGLAPRGKAPHEPIRKALEGQQTVPLEVHHDPQRTIPLRVHARGDAQRASPTQVNVDQPPPSRVPAVGMPRGQVARAARRGRLALASAILVALFALGYAIATPGSPTSAPPIAAMIDLQYPPPSRDPAPERVVALSDVGWAKARAVPPAPTKRRTRVPQIVIAPMAVVPTVAAAPVVPVAPIAPPLTAPATPPLAAVVADTSAVAVGRLYRQLGMDLTVLARTHGSNAAEDLWLRYRLVRFQDMIATEASRARGSEIMLSIQRETARRALP